ncbi:sensor histidine kinase [Nonomuraea sp. NPDC059194]|uniref:sensor histidine kinase n=1 Tax=Nonomuraea sp. NPDC059194 TaxID=3346764 RepID=UPI0036AC1560
MNFSVLPLAATVVPLAATVVPLAATVVPLVATVVPLVAAVVALAWVVVGGARGRSRLPVLAGAAAGLSLAVTLWYMISGPRRGEDLMGLAESLTLAALVGLIARWSPVRQAVPSGVVTGLAASVWLLRYLVPASPLEALGMCAFWGLGVCGVAGVGGYLRSLDTRRVRAVEDERARQRLRLARDLHDFVAHDVSEMVAQAQAGQVVGVAEPAQALAALQRVEQAGLRAMETLDRTVLELHDSPRLDGLAELAARFTAAGSARVELAVEEVEAPEEVAGLGYRVVVEALTNVRRHAQEATRVDVAVRAEGGTLVVTVTNDGVGGGEREGRGGGVDGGVGGGERGSRRGGFGLSGLAEQVEAMGGTLRAAAVPGGWSLVARLPLAR